MLIYIHPLTICKVLIQCISVSCRERKNVTDNAFLIAGYMKYYGDKAGLVAAVYVRLGAAYHRMDQHDQATHCLDEADRIYKVIPGSHSSFYAQEFRPVYKKIANQ